MRGRSARWFLLWILLVGAIAHAEGIVIFQWTDDEGRQHYTNNYNSIPGPFRKSAVKGTFVPDVEAQPTKPKCENIEPQVETNYYAKAGSLHVEGNLANGNVRSVSYVKVKVSFFDTQDQFVRAESTFIDPLELAPCAKGVFSVVTPQTDGISYFKIEYTYK